MHCILRPRSWTLTLSHTKFWKLAPLSHTFPWKSTPFTYLQPEKWTPFDSDGASPYSTLSYFVTAIYRNVIKFLFNYIFNFYQWFYLFYFLFFNSSLKASFIQFWSPTSMNIEKSYPTILMMEKLMFFW